MMARRSVSPLGVFRSEPSELPHVENKKKRRRATKKEMEAHLYLDSLGCLDVAGTAACLDAAEERKVCAGVAK